MKGRILAAFLAVSFLSSFTVQAQTSAESADSTEPVPYSEDEFPQWSKDLRRAEIVTLGSLPFVTIGATAGYSSFLYFSGKRDKFPNPFDKNNGFSTGEIIGVVGTSLGISLAVGLTDYIISYVQRQKAEQRRALKEASDRENVRPITPEEAAELLRKNQDSPPADSGENGEEP